MRFCSNHLLFSLSSRLDSNDTIDSVLRHREVGRAKDLAAPRYDRDLERCQGNTDYRIIYSVGWKKDC